MSSPSVTPEAQTADLCAITQSQTSESPTEVQTTSSLISATVSSASIANAGSTETAIFPASSAPNPQTPMARPPFPYGVLPRPIFHTGGPQQSPSAPALKFTPPMPPAALQPPAPIHSFGNRPSFSYNVFPHATVTSSAGHQFRPAMATNQVHIHGVNPSLHPPVPAQYMRPNPMIPGSFQQSIMRPVGQVTASNTYSFGGSPQSTQPTTTNASEKKVNPTNGTSNVVTTEAGVQSKESACSQPINSSSSMPLSSSTASTQSPISNLAPFSVPCPQNIQSRIYPPYTSAPAITQIPQGPWSTPPSAGALQHTSYSPYALPFPLPMRAVPLPYSSSPNMHPPGATTVVSSNVTAIGTTTTNIDYEKETTDLHQPGEDTKSEEEDTWTAHRTESGTIYYYNSITGESTYDKPSSFKGEAEKAVEQPNPVSWEKIAGTDWTLITTNDGKKYYYDAKNKVSSWQVPSEAAEMRKNQEKDSFTGNTSQEDNSITKIENVPTPIITTPALQTGGREASSGHISSSALDLIKKKLQDTGAPSNSTNSELTSSKVLDAVAKGEESSDGKDKVKDSNGEGNLSDSSSDSDGEESGPTKDDCVKQFKEMLKERGVAPFSKWDKELPKIVFDPRFKAVPSHSARRSIFEHFVRTRAEEERKEKRAAQKAAIGGFKQLLEEATEDIDHKTDYQTFKRKWGKDPRFEALDRKERELLLNEKVLQLKKAREEKNQAAATSFKTMLRENNITVSSHWSKVKDTVRSDSRYKSVNHEGKEALFNEYISELKAAEGEAEQATKAKKDEHDKLKEREREMRKRKEREEQEMEKIRLKIRKKEAVSSYQALLVETIKDPKASWTESKPKLDKDPQGRATNPDLDKSDAEKLFRDHIKDLLERCSRDYRHLLAEVITTKTAVKMTKDGKNALNSWTEAKQLLKSDPRYSKMPRKERESMWRRYADDMIKKQKAATSDTMENLEKEAKDNKLSADLSKRSPRRSHGRR